MCHIGYLLNNYCLWFTRVQVSKLTSFFWFPHVGACPGPCPGGISVAACLLVIFVISEFLTFVDPNDIMAVVRLNCHCFTPCCIWALGHIVMPFTRCW